MDEGTSASVLATDHSIAANTDQPRPRLYLLLNNIGKWNNVRDMLSTAKQHGVHEVLIGERSRPT